MMLKNNILSAKGFTLIEVALVCLILGIFLVITIPTMRSSILDDPLKTASRQLAFHIKSARLLAKRTSKPHIFYIDQKNGEIIYLPASQFTDTDIRENSNTGSPLRLDDVKIKDVWTASQGKQHNKPVELLITRQGYMDRVIIHLQYHNKTMSLEIAPFLIETVVREGYVAIN